MSVHRCCPICKGYCCEAIDDSRGQHHALSGSRHVCKFCDDGSRHRDKLRDARRVARRAYEPPTEKTMPIRPSPASFHTEHHLPTEIICEAIRLWTEKHHAALGLEPHELGLVSLRFTGADTDTMKVIVSVPRRVRHD